MTKAEARREFAVMAGLGEGGIELDRAGLLLAAEEYAHLDVGQYLARLDGFAARVADAGAPRDRLFGLNDYLFRELGFKGNVEDYFDARNSFLNDVMDRRTGIPITLSVIYIEVARRVGLRIEGVGMPGHFIVRYRDGEGDLFIDPFGGGRVIGEDECRGKVAELYGAAMPFRKSFLDPVSKRQILTRMLQNLKGIYLRAAAYHQALGVIERALLLTPDAAAEVRDRGLALAGLGRDAAALADLENYLRRRPGAADAGLIAERVTEVRKRQARLN